MTLLSRGLSFLNRKAKAELAETVRYFRGNDVIEDLQAAPGTQDLTESIDGEVTLIGTRHRWSFEPDDLLMGGDLIEPRRGDIITLDQIGYTLVFEVLPSDGERHWFPMGPADSGGNRRIGVWTKLVERRLST